MSATTFSIDLNAHITDISCEITLEDGKPIAHISFRNAGPRAITAVKFKAGGFNSFGDVIAVNGDDVFSLVIQDIKVEPNAQAEITFKDLPNTDIRKLDLIEDQVCFPDGSVVAYDGENKRDIEIKKILPEEVGQEEYKALQDKFGDYLYYPQEIDDYGWICCCGKYNSKEVNQCPQCNNFKNDVFKINEEGFIDQITADYQEKVEKQEEEKKKQAEIAELNEKKQRRKKNTITGVVIAVIAAVVIGLIIWLIVASSQPRFESESEMKSAVNGVYTYYLDIDNSPFKQLNVDTTKKTVTERWYDLDSASDDVWYITSFDPQRGQIEITTKTSSLSRTITVNKDGSLTYLSDKYEKSGVWTNSSGSSSSSSSSSNSSGSSRSSTETGQTALKVTVSSVRSSGNYTVCKGKVTNNGSKTYSYVMVKGAFKDSSGNVIDTESTYAVGSEGLAPGESSSFDIYVSKDSKISECTVTVYSYKN